MRAFTGEEKMDLYDEAFALLERAQKLLLAARKDHEQAIAFIATLLLDKPSSEDLRHAVMAYKAGQIRELPRFNDSVRGEADQSMIMHNPCPCADAPTSPANVKFIELKR